jgi:hypothetical protein
MLNSRTRTYLATCPVVWWAGLAPEPCELIQCVCGSVRGVAIDDP